MNSLNLAEDILPVSEFRADINSMIQKTKKTHRPIVLTQHGKTSAVVLDINDYQRLIYERQLFEEVKLAKQQVEEGKFHTTSDLKSMLRKRNFNGKDNLV